MPSLFRIRHALFAAPLLFAACGDDGDTQADASGDTAEVRGDSDGPDGGGGDAADSVESDTAVEMDSDTGGGDTGVADTGGGDTGAGDTGGGDTGGGDAEVVEPVVNRATLSIDGAVSEVTVAVRRGMVLTETVQKVAPGGLNQPNVLECPGTGGLADGGRIINPTSANISGNFGSNCDPGGSGANFRLGEEGMLYSARQACGGRTGRCEVDLTENFMLRFGQCNYGTVGLTVQYNCEALATGPSFILEVPTNLGTLRVEGLDGLGVMSCTERGARFRLESTPLTWDAEAPCTVEITERTGTRLAGRIEGTLRAGELVEHVIVDFESNETRVRAAAIALFSDDICASQEITASVRTVGGETFDDFTTGTLACQANPARTVAPFVISVPRPRDGQAASPVAVAQGQNQFSAFEREYRFDAEASRIRSAMYNLSLCADAQFQSCPVQVPVLYFQSER